MIQGENIVKLSLGPKRKRTGKYGKKYFVRNYTKWNLTKLTVLENYDNWEKLSKPRNLAYSSGKVYVTDRGLHKVDALAFDKVLNLAPKVLIVNLESGSQSASGYLGSEVFKSYVSNLFEKHQLINCNQ